MSSIKTNVIYKAILIFSNYIFGFITFPYITRVLGPSNFGLVNFALSVTDYFLLFATMGIATIGTREIAACRGDKKVLETQFSKLLGINLLFTLITTAIYIICILTITKFKIHAELLWVGLAKVLFSAFIVEWFFSGLENFRYITIRSFIIRAVYVLSVFIFIKTSEDYFLYFILTIATVVVNAIINFVYSSRYVKVVWKSLRDFSFFKQNLQLGFYMIMTSMYITFNVMYLGLVSSDEEVGYYSAAVKLYFIAVNLFSAFTSVMIPRMAAVYANEQGEKGREYIRKSYSLVWTFSLPIMILGIYFTPEIISLLSGDGYSSAILPMRILMFALLFVCLAQVLVYQGLIPMKKDALLTRASVIGGILALALNIIVTPQLKCVGSAIVLVCSEGVITIYYLVCVYRKSLFPLPTLKSLGKGLLVAVPYVAISIIAGIFCRGLMALVVALVFDAIYFISLYKFWSQYILIK